MKEAEFDANLEEQLRCIAYADANAAVPYVSCKITGYAPMDLLEKLNDQAPLDAEDEGALQRLNARLEKICGAAARRNVSLYVDAEESWIQDAIDRIVEGLMETWNRDKATVHNTVQLYRHDRLAYLKRCHARAASEQTCRS